VVTDACEQWNLGRGLAGDVVLPVSELVTNAIVHARTTIRLIISVASGCLEVAVRDQSVQPPRLRAVRTSLLEDLDSIGTDGVMPSGPNDPAWIVGPSGSVIAGRGLQIVAATTETWGVAEFIGGKDVWLRLGIPASWEPESPCPCAAGNLRTPGGLPLHLTGT
jgi:hypothetical protein